MKKQLLILSIILCCSLFLRAQEQIFSLEDCINYAFENSTDISRANNNVRMQNAYLEQSKASRFPNLSLGINQNFNSANDYNGTDNTWNRNNNTSLNVSLISQVTLYNGAKIKNTIKQNKNSSETAKLDIQTEKELISLNILSAYIEVLLAKENNNNSQIQMEETEKLLTYARAKKEAGVISESDLLYIKSQLASDKTTYIEAKNNLRITLVSLMQLMNMPVSNDFDIKQPDVDKILKENIETSPEIVYKIALDLQSYIQTAKLDIEGSKIGINIAKADALPVLNLNGGISTGSGSNIYNVNIGEQFAYSTSPYVGLSLSVPIFQQKQTKTKIKIAQIDVKNSELYLTDMKNLLRKYIEQACTDAETALSNYSALSEQLNAEKESYRLADELFTQGMINTVDFLISKNNLIESENEFTQAKYKLILQNNVIDYYLGNSVTL